MDSAAGRLGLMPLTKDECDSSSPPSPPESPAPSASDESDFAEGVCEFLETWDATDGVGVERSLEEALGLEPGKPSLCLTC